MAKRKKRKRVWTPKQLKFLDQLREQVRANPDEPLLLLLTEPMLDVPLEEIMEACGMTNHTMIDPIRNRTVMTSPDPRVGLHGHIFKHDGRVAGTLTNRKDASPPTADAIPFKVFAIHASDGNSPPWADVTVGKVSVRINSDIIAPPYWRLFDCLHVACAQWNNIPRFPVFLQGTLPPAPHPNAKQFGFAKMTFGDKDVVMVDRWERIQAAQSEQLLEN